MDSRMWLMQALGFSSPQWVLLFQRGFPITEGVGERGGRGTSQNGLVLLVRRPGNRWNCLGALHVLQVLQIYSNFPQTSDGLDAAACPCRSLCRTVGSTSRCALRRLVQMLARPTTHRLRCPQLQWQQHRGCLQRTGQPLQVHVQLLRHSHVTSARLLLCGRPMGVCPPYTEQKQ